MSEQRQWGRRRGDVEKSTMGEIKGWMLFGGLMAYVIGMGAFFWWVIGLGL